MPSKSSSKTKPRGGARHAGKRAADAPSPSAQKSGASDAPPKRPKRKRPPPQPKSPQQRLKVPEAMRLHGMDEEQFAKQMRGFINKLSKQSGSSKLFLDGLKEWGRHLVPDRSADRVLSETPVTVQLVHQIPRPVREAPVQDPSALTHEESGG